jgi:hypothetical protein
MIKGLNLASLVSPLILPNAIEAVHHGQARSSTRRANACNKSWGIFRSVFDFEQKWTKNVSWNLLAMPIAGD